MYYGDHVLFAMSNETVLDIMIYEQNRQFVFGNTASYLLGNLDLESHTQAYFRKLVSFPSYQLQFCNDYV